MSDDDRLKKYSNLIKSRGGTSNPMKRLERLGPGPEAGMHESAASTSGASGSDAATTSGASPSPAAASGVNGANAPTTSGASSSTAPRSGAAKRFLPNLTPKTQRVSAPPPEERRVGNAPRERRQYAPRTDSRGRGGRGRGGRGRGANPNLVQTSSIFDEGVASLESRRVGGSAPSYGGGGGGGSDSVRERVVITNKESQVGKQREKALEKLFSDDFVEPLPHLESEISPNSLPLYVEEKEASDATTTSFGGVKRKAPSLLDALSLDETDESRDPRMIFFQLPDCLPFDSLDREIKQESETPSAKTNASSEESVTERGDADLEDMDVDPILKSHADNPNAATLRKLPEGQIGRLRVRASGKSELVFPNGFVFDLNLGTPSGFYQEFVSVTLDEENREGEMASLGPVSHKVIAVPNFETLLLNNSIGLS